MRLELINQLIYDDLMPDEVKVKNVRWVLSVKQMFSWLAVFNDIRL